MFEIKRIKQIVAPSDLIGPEGENINGPTCIKVPSWCENRLAKYYLYFAHHRGTNIRMCYSNDLLGKWTHLRGGVVKLNDMNDAHHHVASPEVYVNSKEKLIYLYFHAPSYSKGEQWTFLAISKDGINFDRLIDRPLAPFYMRVFYYSDYMYGIVKGGGLWKSRDGIEKFELVANPFNPLLLKEFWHNHSGAIRHVGLYLDKHSLHIFFSRIGDKPERILHASIDLNNSKDKDWRVGKYTEIIKPEEKYEGAGLELEESNAGAAHNPKNELRDPFVMFELNSFYLFYSVSGEQGIALSQFNKLPEKI